MMRRRFRPRSRCLFSVDTILNSAQGAAIGPLNSIPGSPTYWFSRLPVMQAGRTKWLCETGRRKSILVTGILFWFDFYWSNTSALSGLPDCHFYVKEFSEDAIGDASQFWLPFTLPPVPNSINNWDTTTDASGTDSFMWRHWIKGLSPPNTQVATYTGGANGADNNTTAFMAAGGAGAQTVYMTRKFSVTQEWQPDVRIKTRRKLSPNMGIEIAMMNPQATAPAVQCNLQFKALVYGR